MTKWPSISLSRLVAVRNEAFADRRALNQDTEFFKMTDVWEELCSEGDAWKIKKYNSGVGDNYKRKAGIVAFGDRVTLTVDEFLWRMAEKGAEFANFLLGHELGHLICNHHASSAATKNFQLVNGETGMSNIPPTAEEWEASIAAVYFQCGPEIESDRLTDRELAKRAHSDERTIRRVRKYCRLEGYQRESSKPRKRNERVIL